MGHLSLSHTLTVRSLSVTMAAHSEVNSNSEVCLHSAHLFGSVDVGLAFAQCYRDRRV